MLLHDTNNIHVYFSLDTCIVGIVANYPHVVGDLPGLSVRTCSALGLACGALHTVLVLRGGVGWLKRQSQPNK